VLNRSASAVPGQLYDSMVADAEKSIEDETEEDE